MSDTVPRPTKAYRNQEFLGRRQARPLRILAEYLEPEARFEDHQVSDTIVFMGSARIEPPDKADAGAAGMAKYYDDARELARRLTEWSKGLDDSRRRFVVCTGGGPGIMEAANRGASEAKGLNVGLNISIPDEQHENPYVTRHLTFEFHYFFMRKFWFVYLAKAIVIFPGGFGTLDEFFEIMTLIQTGKLRKPMPVILYGNAYWDQVIDFDAMVRHGTIGAEDLELFYRADSVDDAFRFIVGKLTGTALAEPGGIL